MNCHTQLIRFSHTQWCDRAIKEQEEKLEREQKQKRQVDELLANPPDLIRDFIESIKRVVK